MFYARIWYLTTRVFVTVLPSTRTLRVLVRVESKDVIWQRENALKNALESGSATRDELGATRSGV